MNNPKRILHVVVNMNCGGAETLIMNLYRNIDRSRFQFDFLVHRKAKGVYEDEIIALGGRIYRIPYITDTGFYGYKKALDNFFIEHLEYKVVHAHMNCMSSLVLGAARKSRIPVRIAHSHNTRNGGNFLSRIYKYTIGLKLVKNSTHLLACSDKAAKWLFKRHFRDAVILKNGIEAERFLYNADARDTKRKELNIKDDTLLIGHIGRFDYQKNHTFLLDVFLSIRKQNTNCILLLVGDGYLRHKMEAKANKLKLDNNVIFLGIRNDVPDLMQCMDLFLFPSHFEGLPLTLIEAQAAGLKCVISDTISKDCDVGAGLISFLSLKKGVEPWVNEALKDREPRGNKREYLEISGFDIVNIARHMENYYTNIQKPMQPCKLNVNWSDIG